ncbi:AfsR/SARP family transcriptional regulator [Anoxynatronum buryatiense]|uniref:Transcriptional activator domain-containing protein n=1 Tax=Anoxynatronum buryatiense TaxID=489973 RepID=A0AA45WY91_9CLOT|nr:BTAD domain-containing putative transcriptional regulator [Anoxynatronum buryatiense]SMP67985.1 transcriptional activator domain-containing protein [Anoxynatronum buryatiense]
MVHQENRLTSRSDSVLIIRTLGRFSVQKNGCTLTAESRSSKKIWTLFKYLLTFRNKSLLPETIADHLWPDQNYSNPRNLLRTQSHRLRKMLGEHNDSSGPIAYQNGCYFWNETPSCLIDILQFESLSKEARSISNTAPREAVECFREALDYYLGDYLPECAEEEWVIPPRIHYRRLFIENVLSLCHLLTQYQQYTQVLETAEKAISLEPCEESFHLVLLNTLLRLNHRREALAHYQYVTTYLYRELGVSPSNALKQIYRQLHNSDSSFEIPIAIDSSDNLHHPSDQAYLCAPDVFRSLAEIEARRNQRDNRPFYICFFSLAYDDSTRHDRLDLPHRGHERLQLFLMSNLRQGDVLTRWSEASYAVLFNCLAETGLPQVIERLLLRYNDAPLIPRSRLSASITESLDALPR